MTLDSLISIISFRSIVLTKFILFDIKDITTFFSCNHATCENSVQPTQMGAGAVKRGGILGRMELGSHIRKYKSP